jgi:serpin B
MTPLIAQEAPAWIGPGNNAFATDLYAKLAAKRQGNLFFPPNSIQTALTMTYAGARGTTATQMATDLHLPADRAAIDKDFGEYLSGLKNAGKSGYELMEPD